MINLLLGAPGGGKSYEAVVYHILPALQQGRKVITNLSLKLEAIEPLYPNARELIEIRTGTKAERPEVDWEKAQALYQRFGIAHKQRQFNPSAFSNVADYGDPWRHPETGSGPLYVIDECHICLPRLSTPVSVEEWYSLHRHESADVLLITQSYGKVNKAIIDLVQVVYRVRKNVAFGSSGSYTHKVQDGIRGEVVNTSIRRYEKRYFKFYQSHTKGGGQELQANDITPFWKRWPFMGVGICASVLIYMFSTQDMNFLKTPQKPASRAVRPQNTPVPMPTPQPVKYIQTEQGGQGGPPLAGSALTVPAPTEIDSPGDLLEGRGLHILAHITGETKEVWKFGLSQNGQATTMLDLNDLRLAGYSWKPYGDCLGILSGNGTKRTIACDAPTLSATVGGVEPEPSPAGPAPLPTPPAGAI